MYFLLDGSVFGQHLHKLITREVDVCLYKKYGLDGRNSEPISAVCPYDIHLREHPLYWYITAG